MDTDTVLTVGDLARLAGLTIRTLHHYDEIGLVVPATRTDAGYRLYGRREVERLQEVLVLRELGFGLDEIKAIVDTPGYDRTEALHRQRTLLEAKAQRMLEMIDAVDTIIEKERQGMKISDEDMLEVFGEFDPNEYEAEVEERWGATDAYRESTRRASSYTKQDWETLGAEADEISAEFLELMDAGVAADSPEATAVAERHRAHISKWFYDCTPEIHAGLGRMYVADSRFTENIDKAGPGLAQYMSEAIAANAEV
jgi:MerR family transcriptional regulator, thiopeptide resistance regulator